MVRAGAVFAGLAWGIGRVRRGSSRPGALRDPLSLALLLLVGAEVLGTLSSVAPAVSFWGISPRQQGLLTHLAFVVLFLCARDALRDAAARRRLVTAVILGSIPVCLYAVAQRIGLDPLPWNRPMGQRTTATLGNPIFLGSYVAAVSLPTLGRLWVAVRSAGGLSGAHGRLGSGLWGGAHYGLLLVLQLTSLWLTRSRGPLLAWGVGLLVFLLCIRRRDGFHRGTLRVAAAAGLVVAGGLASGVLAALATGVLSVAAGAGEVLRAAWFWAGLALAAAVGLRLLRVAARQAAPAWLSVTAVLVLLAFGFGVRVEPAGPPGADRVEEGWAWNPWTSAREGMDRVATARERVLYWRGYLAAFASPDPVRRIPSGPGDPGEPDLFHRLRPLVGYGPETAGAIFQRHAPPELPERHGLDVTADRAHNLVWDRLLATGVLGLAAFLWFVARLLDRGLRDRSGGGPSAGRRLDPWFFGGAGAGGLAGGLAFGAELLGVGIQVGIVVGVLAFLVVRRRSRPPSGSRDADAPVAGGAAAALLCLLAEWTVGFPVVTTQLLFWLFAALLLAHADEGAEERNAASGEEADPEVEGDGRRAAAELRPTPVVVGLALGVAILAFPPVFQVYAGLLLTTWIWAVALTAPDDAVPRARHRLREGHGLLAWPGLAVAGGAGLALLALQVLVDWARSAAASAEGWERVADLAAIEAGRTETFYGWWALAVVVLASSLPGRAEGEGGPRRTPRPLGVAVGLLALAAGTAVVWAVSVRPARADILAHAAVRWSTTATDPRMTSRPPGHSRPGGEVTTALLQRAAAEASWDESLHLRLAGGSTAFDRFSLARSSLERAERLHPVDPMIVLGRGHLYRRWAMRSDDGPERRRRRRLSAAWYERAREILGPLPEIERHLGEVDEPDPRAGRSSAPVPWAP